MLVLWENKASFMSRLAQFWKVPTCNWLEISVVRCWCCKTGLAWMLRCAGRGLPWRSKISGVQAPPRRSGLPFANIFVEPHDGKVTRVTSWDSWSLKMFEVWNAQNTLYAIHCYTVCMQNLAHGMMAQDNGIAGDRLCANFVSAQLLVVEGSCTP